MGANSLLMILLFVGILAIVNFLAARHSIRWDLSENQNFSLAPQTHRVLRNLLREVKITVFTREKDPGYQPIKNGWIVIGKPARQDFRGVRRPGTAAENRPKLWHYKNRYGRFRKRRAQTVRVTNPSEVELTGALIRVSKDDKKRILFLEGHGEPELGRSGPDRTSRSPKRF